MQDFYIIGHRGAAGEKFENSLCGFKHALKLNIDAVELDIRQHSGELWVIHDNDLKRLTGSTGNFEDSVDPAQLRLLNDEPIPILSEVLDLYWGKMPLNIEIKSINTGRLLLELLDRYPVIEKESSFPWILISSYDHRQIVDLKRDSCPWELAPIISGKPKKINRLIEDINPFSIHINGNYINMAVIKQIQSQGVQAMIFTVNERDQVVNLKRNGINGVFTNYPSRFLNIN